MSLQGTGTLIYTLDDPLHEIQNNLSVFKDVVCSHLEFLLNPYQLVGDISVARINEAHHYLTRDIARISRNDFNGGRPDHFKQAGHICYWIRRTRPVTDLAVHLYSTKTDLSPEDAYADEYRLFFNYINDYLAFDLGFHLVLFYHLYNKKNPLKINAKMFPSWDFIECTSHFLNAKNVSPHAMYLIYKALFDHLGASLLRP